MSTTRTCPSCGTEANATERFCPNCGTRLPEEQPAIAPTIPIGQQGATPPPPVTPLPGSYGASEGQGPYSIPADASAAPPRRKGLPVWAIILLSLAGLCGLGCLGTAAFIAVVGIQTEQAASTMVAEVGTQSAATREAQATAGIDPDALIEETPEATPEDVLEATPEATPAVLGALPTREPTASGVGGVVGDSGAPGAAAIAQTAQAATAEAATTAQAADLLATARVIFQDEFVDNRNNWFTGVFNDIETDVIEDGVFKVIWAADGTSYELYEPRALTNFIAEVDCQVVQGGGDGSCGLIFGQTDDVGFYKYEVFEDYYRIFVVRAEGDPETLAEGDPTEVVRPGETNKLRVVRQGETITLLLNDVPLVALTDATYASGKVGVSTSSYAEAGGVEIWFDNFTIWELP